MSRLAEFTLVEWIGHIGLIFFTGALIWSLVHWHKSPPKR